MPDSLVGRSLAHYRILEQIGAGAMGVVYRARDWRLQRDVALKVLTPGALGDSSGRRRLEAEALSISRLNHPNIATVHDFDSADGVDFLVMELVEGHSLDERLSGGPLHEGEIVRLGMQLADGLVAAHDSGVVHRDLKPANIRITADGRLKILDFGLARSTPKAASHAATETSGSSQAIAGTPAYMAPEQLRGEPPDPRTDVYAAGLVLYEMATGRRAFTESGVLLTDAILHRDVGPIAAVNPAISPALQQIVAKACDKDPSRRYQAAAELAVDLRRIGQPSQAGVPAWPRRPRRAALLAAASAVLLLGIVAGGWALREWRGADRTVSSLAVLPFSTVDAQAVYASEGLTTAVTNELAQLPGVRVMAETTANRYRGRDDVAAAGREMRVDAVMTGRLLADRTFSAELVHVSSGTQLWSMHDVRADANLAGVARFAARSISNRLNLTLDAPARQRLERSASANPEAYDLFLRGTYLMNTEEKTSAVKSFAHFHRALELDPDFAEALASLSFAYENWGPDAGVPVSENIVRARRFAERAIEIDDSLAAGHAALASTLLGSEWDVRRAEREARRAVELNPSSGFARAEYSFCLLAQGRFEESIGQLMAWQQNDPGTIGPQMRLTFTYFMARDYARALAAVARVEEVEPGRTGSTVAWTYAMTGRAADAIAEFRRLLPEEKGTHAAALRAAAASGRLPAWFRAMGARAETITGAGLTGVPDDAGVPSAVNLAWYWANAGDADRAFQWLDRAYERRHTHMILLKVDPRWDPIRSDPRFAALVARVEQR